MKIFTRKRGQSILIAPNVEIVVLSGRARIGVIAPASVKVERKEKAKPTSQCTEKSKERI